MEKKYLIPLFDDQVAPRFDLATEVSIVTLDAKGQPVEKRTVVLPRASAEDLCHLILLEKIETLVCGGIEDEYYQYLKWKKVTVLDSVIGSYKDVIKRLGAIPSEKGVPTAKKIREEK
ncbi:MAG: dinitrogenase iron-molybdenum cofactor biosynthesis protein [Candidatus Magnetomorum sp.]|nr:dinitrogenase iron-molybdenum cofactor biosynthesis protein [Candidatus Magnetomorum sp.]